MTGKFGSLYSHAYDALYHDKDYHAECDLIEQIFETYRDGPILDVVDLGCGTGNHALLLSGRGYHVTGVDCSDEMLREAERKRMQSRAPDQTVFTPGDLRALQLGRVFDAALMMFAVLGYQVRNDDVLTTLRAARAHIRPSGLLVFDVWYGPAVLYQRTSERIKIVPTPQGQILRVSSSRMDTARHVCLVQYRLWVLERQRIVSEAEEHHQVRYFFPLELELFLRSSGFRLLRLGAFPGFEEDPQEATWNILAVAQAV